MKILLSWIQDFVEIKTSSEKLAERLSVSLAEVERTEKIEDEILFEIENKALTHRPDCFSLIGMAREIAAITDSKFKPPPIGKDVDQNAVSLPLKIEVVNSDLCPRYTAVVITNLKIGPSPTDIQKRLRLSGIRPLGNLVDITNYIMLEWGQPLHAFDYDKLSDEKKIIVRTALPREKINTLDGVERQLDPKMLLIADSVKPIGIAGIMGGSNTEISKTTKTIVLESANFNHFNNRYTSLHLGLRTEASTRFEKGQDPEKTLTALLKAIEMYRHYACGKPASEIFDFYPKPEKQKTIIFCPQKVSEKLGINLVFGKIEKIFNSLNLQITKDAEIWKITIPTYRRDLTIEADLLEEIARIYGYDQIKPSLPPRTLKPPKQNAETIFERKIKNILLRLSLSEIYTYSFVDPKLWKKCLMNSDALLKLKNPLSPELSLVRNNLLPALVDKIALNSKYFAEFSLFEVGKAINHQAKNILPLEVKEVAGGIYSQNELPLLAPWYPPRRIPVSPSGGGGAASSKSFDSSTSASWRTVVFSNDYKMDIERIGKVLGFLPLALNIILTKIRQGKNESVSELTKILEREKSRLELLACEEISIRSSFEISFTTLDEKLKRLFESLAVFCGEDFSQEAASFVNKLDSIICHELLNQLCGKSLLDYSQSGRFFLHPLLKVFAKEKIMTREPFLLAAQYYTDFLEKRVRQKQFANYELLNQELDNMIAICDWTFENKEQDLFLGLWKNISRFIAEVGLWDELERLGLLVYRCSDLPKYQDIKADCCINVLSWINFWKGNLEKAKGWAREGYEIAQKTKNLHLRSLAQNRLAFIFDREGNVGEAGELIDLSLEGLKKVNDLSQIAETLRYLTYIPYIKPSHSSKI